jgi:hypothetical protein
MLHEALEIHRDLGDRWRMTSVLDDLAAAALTAQPPSPARAARLLGAAQRIRDAIGTAIAPCERADHARTEAATRAALGEAAFADLARAGAAGPLDAVLAGSGAHTTAAVPPDAGTPQASRIEFLPNANAVAIAVPRAARRPRHGPEPAARRACRRPGRTGRPVSRCGSGCSGRQRRTWPAGC